MKSKIIVRDITSQDISLNELNNPMYNGILSFQFDKTYSYPESLPSKLNGMEKGRISTVIENIYDDSTKVLLQKMYYDGSDYYRVFYRIGYPKNYKIDNITVGINDYNYTTWSEDSFNNTKLNYYILKNEANSKYLQDTPEWRSKIAKYFTYKALILNGDFNTSRETGFYAVSGVCPNVPTALASTSIGGILEVFDTSVSTTQVLYVTVPFSHQRIYFRFLNKGTNSWGNWVICDYIDPYINRDAEINNHINTWNADVVHYSYLSSGTGNNETLTGEQWLSPNDEPIYTMTFPTAAMRMRSNATGSSNFTGTFGIARRSWRQTYYNNGSPRDVEVGRWG